MNIMNKKQQNLDELEISRLSRDGKVFTGGFSGIVKGESLEDFIKKGLDKPQVYG